MSNTIVTSDIACSSVYPMGKDIERYHFGIGQSDIGKIVKKHFYFYFLPKAILNDIEMFTVQDGNDIPSLSVIPISDIMPDEKC